MRAGPGLDPNQTSAVLDKLGETGILRAEEMVECPDCGMAVLRSDYEATIEEEDEYRCTSCDQPVTDAGVTSITTYRRGEKWRPPLVPKKDSQGVDPGDDDGKPAPAKPGFVPTPDDLQILRAIEDSPTTLTLVGIEAATSISRKTVGERVKVFRQHGLVHEPHRRKGIALSEAGHALLKHIRSKSTGTNTARG